MISEKKRGYKTGHRVGSLFCNNDWKNTKTLAVVIPVVVRMTCISSWSLFIYSRFSAMNLEYDFCTYQDYFRRKFIDFIKCLSNSTVLAPQMMQRYVSHGHCTQITLKSGLGTGVHFSAQDCGLWNQTAWVQVLLLLLPCYVTWASMLTFLCFGCLICKMGIIVIPVRISWAVTCENLEEQLALGNHYWNVSCDLLMVKSFAFGVTLSGFKTTFLPQFLNL